jgi:hypothetical protein
MVVSIDNRDGKTGYHFPLFSHYMWKIGNKCNKYWRSLLTTLKSGFWCKRGSEGGGGETAGG